MTTSSDLRQDFLDRFLPSSISIKGKGKAFAPSNIALSKYWGKRNAALNLPCNSSLSISLAHWGSETVVGPSGTDQDEIVFNDEDMPLAHPAAQKMLSHADLFRRSSNIPMRIVTSNTIPTAAGLASSASGFAALTLALDRAFGLDLPHNVLSMIARLGSGSAARSFWHGFVRWDRGSADDGTDSIAQALDVIWPELRIAIVSVDTKPKSHSSRDGMNHTVDTSPLFPAWPEQAERDCAEIEKAVRAQDLQALGALAEANALAMHATMIAARPALSYLTAESWNILAQLKEARRDGLQAYATMDAGPNVKLVFESQDINRIKSIFPDAIIIAPFDDPPDL